MGEYMDRVEAEKDLSAIDVRYQKPVILLCNLAKKTPIVKRIIVFGSAATQTCNDNSDIDICYDISCSTQDQRVRDLSLKTSMLCDYNCDVVYYNLIGTNLKKEIDTKGITVYEA